HADVRVEIEDSVLGQLAVAIDERRGMMQLSERPPDRLVDAERVRVLDEGGKEQVERFAWVAAAGQMAREGEPCAPVLRILVDQPPAQTREPLRAAGAERERLEPIESQVRAVGRDLNQPLPDHRR